MSALADYKCCLDLLKFVLEDSLLLLLLLVAWVLFFWFISRMISWFYGYRVALLEERDYLYVFSLELGTVRLPN